MDKRLIERIALEATQQFGFDIDDEFITLIKVIVERIDAERGKGAVAILHSDGYWTIAKSASPDLRERLKTFGCRVPVFLSQTIPEGMALVPIEPTQQMVMVGSEAFSDGLDARLENKEPWGEENKAPMASRVAYRAMLAAAQRERNA